MRSFLSARPVVVLAVACSFATPFALAEDVVTKTDGAKLRGKILLDTPEEVQIKTAGGVLRIPREEVSSVERAKDLAAELASRTKDLEKHQTAKGGVDLAHCREGHDLRA